MKLDDVLAMAGEHQLSQFDWGTSAVTLYNGLVATENHIDVSHTGKQAYDKLRKLPSSTLLIVLNREVQIEGVGVDFVGNIGEPSTGGVPPTVPQSGRKTNPMFVILMVTMSVICLVLVLGSYKNPTGTGSNEALKTVMQTMVELVKEENKTNEQSQQPQTPAPQEPAPAPTETPSP